MKKRTYLFGFLAVFLSFQKTAYSQTTTIDYIQSGLSTSSCNVFNPSVSINNVTHASHAGGVKFNSSEGLILSTNPQSTTPGGTAFFIQYNFLANYKYDISIMAKGRPELQLKSV